MNMVQGGSPHFHGRRGVKPSDLVFASALEASDAIRRGDVSSVELTEHILKRIEKYNPSLNAIVTLTREEAMLRAREADEASARGEVWGPLHGVPCTVKDCFEMACVRTTAGSPELANYIPKGDAVAVERLRKAGAVILGHTNVPLMLSDWQSFNDVFGTTNNPWDLGKTPGGSTGGGAAAVAAGLSFLSLGSDIGGSIRIPAHFCGVYGHKPSADVIPMQGHIPPLPGGPPMPSSGLGVAGIIARNPADLKVALEVLGGLLPDEAVAYGWALPPPRGNHLSDYRLGYVLDDAFDPVSSDVRRVLSHAVEELREAGVDLEEGWPPGVDLREQFDTYRFLRYASSAYTVDEEQLERMRERARRQDGSDEAMEALACTSSLRDFQLASSRKMEARAAWQRYFRDHDAFLMPTAIVQAFDHDHSLPRSRRVLVTPEGPRRYEELRFWISFATLTGNPATIAPVGLTSEGLPVGIQIMGPYLEDSTTIDLAQRMAEVVGGFRAPDGYGDARRI
jgi:amidase